jgi:hypothetical protein
MEPVIFTTVPQGRFETFRTNQMDLHLLGLVVKHIPGARSLIYAKP